MTKFLCALFLMVLLTGCVGSPLIWQLGPGGASGTLKRDVVYPNAIQPQMKSSVEIPYDPDTIEIVGWISDRSMSGDFTVRFPGAGSANVVGLRDSGYEVAMANLMRVHDVDGILNFTVDTKRQVLNLFIARVSDYHTVVSGIGYRFKDRPWAVYDEPRVGFPEDDPTK